MSAAAVTPRVVILGGGFAGLYAARRLAGAPVAVTVVDRTNHHVFQPLLYQVATGVLAPSDITVPIRWRLRRQANATVLLAGATQTFAGNSVNLAIPRLMAAFGTDLATTQWVATTFLIARTLMVPVLGWLGGFLGQRNLFVLIMIGFVLT